MNSSSDEFGSQFDADFKFIISQLLNQKPTFELIGAIALIAHNIFGYKYIVSNSSTFFTIRCCMFETEGCTCKMGIIIPKNVNKMTMETFIFNGFHDTCCKTMENKIFCNAKRILIINEVEDDDKDETTDEISDFLNHLIAHQYRQQKEFDFKMVYDEDAVDKRFFLCNGDITEETTYFTFEDFYNDSTNDSENNHSLDVVITPDSQP